MKRFLELALLLGLIAFVIGNALSVLVFRNVDLRYAPFLQVFLVPAFQAAVLVLLTARHDLAVEPLSHSVMRRPWIALFAGIDLAILAYALSKSIPTPTWWLFARHSFPAYATLAKCLCGAILFLAVARSMTGRARIWCVTLAVGLALWGLDRMDPWLRDVPRWLFPTMPRVYSWSAVYAPLFALAIIVMLMTADALRTRSHLASFLLESATALALVAGMIVIANYFLRPFLADPWHATHRVLTWLVATCLFLASVTAVSERSP